MISGFSVISPIRVWSSQIGLRKRRKCANDVRRFVKMFAFLKVLLWVLFFWNPVYKTPTESGVNPDFRRSWAQLGWRVLFGQFIQTNFCGGIYPASFHVPGLKFPSLNSGSWEIFVCVPEYRNIDAYSMYIFWGKWRDMGQMIQDDGKSSLSPERAQRNNSLPLSL